MKSRWNGGRESWSWRVRNSKKRKLYLWGPWGETESSVFKELKEGQLGRSGRAQSEQGGGELRETDGPAPCKLLSTCWSVPTPFPCQESRWRQHPHLTSVLTRTVSHQCRSAAAELGHTLGFRVNWRHSISRILNAGILHVTTATNPSSPLELFFDFRAPSALFPVPELPAHSLGSFLT